MAKVSKSNPIIIRADTNIGETAAEEDDDFLFNCFFDHPAISILKDPTSPKIFAIGRTGSGKTGILRWIQTNEKNVELDLYKLSMDYLSNSSILRFLDAIDADLDLFFQLLWKHVICLEFIRVKYDVTNNQKSEGVLQRINSLFSRDERKKKAIEYLHSWKDKFWISMDANVKEITERFERKINAEFSGEIEKFKSRAGYARTLSAEKKLELVERAKQIVMSVQLTDLSHVIDLLGNLDRDSYKIYFTLIDRIDERWVDDRIRYQMIRALIESAKSLRKIPDLKLVIALRSDVLERVLIENQHVGFQREKFDTYFFQITWKKEQLRQLTQKRINYLYRHKYTKENVFFDDIFPHKIANKDSFDYILERTLYRPRDIISFVNICLEKAQGETEIRPEHIKAAERDYSAKRLQAMTEEWLSALPSLSSAFNILYGREERFQFSDLSTAEFIDEFVLKVGELKNSDHDPLFQVCDAYLKNTGPGTLARILDIARKLAYQLYRVGAIGVKLRADERYFYSHLDDPIINESSFDNNVKIHIHWMLHRALNVKTNNRRHPPNI